jgi:hypothetical protein
MSIHKPVELLLTNALYDIVIHINGLPEQAVAGMTAEKLAESTARTMAMAVAQLAAPAAVFKMLAAVGGPAGEDEVHRRVCAVREASMRPQAPSEARQVQQQGEPT